MSSLFATLAAAASAQVDRVYGEAWLYQPMAVDDPNGRRSPDPDRAAVTITAAYQSAFARASSGPTRTQGVRPERPGHASERPRISIDLQACVATDGTPSPLPYRPRTRDRLTRIKSGVVYEIAEPRTDDTPRFEADLNIVTVA